MSTEACIKLWWESSKTLPQRQSFSYYPTEDEKRFFKLTFHKQNRELVMDSYLKHVLDEGKEIAVKARQRKLYTNNKTEGWYGNRWSMWSHVVFEHPSTFDTLALETSKKEEIIKDLIRFSKAKDYYKKVGKAWKRGYLLYGPPGTGKSTMIAAMANLLQYDVYDLELTAVKDNTELRKLLIDTSSKSIIVIEDIDCSIDLTGQRKMKIEKDDDEEEEEEEEDAQNVKEAKGAGQCKNENSKVTLSGILNFIDGLWSVCGGERIIVFTTNYMEKLDPALIRRGRMDKHIELSYCGFEAFKILARNYLDIESHWLFESIGKLLEETNMTPADVAENLMPKSDEDEAETCLKNLIKALETAKEEMKKKAEEEEKAKLKAEEELKKKAEEEAEEDKISAEKKDNETAAKEVKENGVVPKE
ncbi:hypothetical protein LguiB_014600 [Lonicera macranthoides]